MKSIAEQTSKNQIALKKRISSANLTSKNNKNMLTHRKTYDEDAFFKEKDVRTNNQYTTRNAKYPPKPQNNFFHCNTHNNHCKDIHRHFVDLIKPIKYEKTTFQSVLIKKCDKTKLIYWNKELVLEGNQKYLVLSADFIIDQDCFWQKLPSDNGNILPNSTCINNTLSSINHNSNSTFRSSNNNSLSSKFSSGNSLGMNPVNVRKNPLLNPNKINSLTKQWKKLHSRIDSENKKNIVLWIIRKQSSYAQIMQLVQLYQLPLHGIFYVKRKRSNMFFDLNPLVKQIHQKFLQALVSSISKLGPGQKSGQSKNDTLNPVRSKQLKSQNNKEFQKTNSQQLKKNFGIMTGRFGTIKKQLKNQQNDQNCSNTLNSATFNQFIGVKNKVYLTKQGILVGQKGTTILTNKIHPQSATRIRSTTIKIKQILQKKQNNQNRQRFRPLITQQVQSSIQTQPKLSQFQFNEPEIIVLQAIKCNSKDLCGVQSYQGKIPILFGYHQKRMGSVRNKLSESQKVTFKLNQSGPLKVSYQTLENVNIDSLQTVNQLLKKSQKMNFSDCQSYSGHRISVFCQTYMVKILAEYEQQKNQKLKNDESQYNGQELQLSEQQQESIGQKTQKKLEQIKTKLINDVIKLKGRNYTFENGQSIYYYVGNLFKRNYNLLYQQNYKAFQRQTMTQLLAKSKKKTIKPSTSQHQTECCSPLESNASKEGLLKLAKLKYYHYDSQN